MKTLNLTFKSNMAKSHTLKLNYAHENLDEKTVRDAMAKIAGAGLFQKGDEIYYTTPYSAKYVSTVDEVIFGKDSNNAE